MNIEGKQESEPSAKDGWTESVKHMTFNISMSVAGPPPCWVVKVTRKGFAPGYLRIPTTSGGIIVGKRMATRFDSAVWAQTLANGVAGAKVVRLWSKQERETQKERLAGVSTTTWGFAVKDGTAAVVEPPKEAPKEAP